MPVPNTFANATTSIPLSQLDQNFATAITLGNTSIQLGNTVTTLNNMTFANVTINSVASTFPNSYLTNNAVTIGNTSVSLGGTQTSFGNMTLTNVTISSVSAAIGVAQGGTGATTLTGVLKGNGTSAFTAATAGTDFVAPGTATTFTATQSFAGSTTALAMKVTDAAEPATVSATAATGTINYDITTQSILYYTTNASGNFTINLRGNGSNTLNSLMATGDVVTVTFLNTNGSTAYYNTAVQVDGTGTGVTTRWLGGTAPTSGNASSIDTYTYAIIKTANATFTVLASQSRFA